MPGHSQRLKQRDKNELERNPRLEKDVSSKQLWLAMEREEDRSAKLENYEPTKLLKLAMETDDERKGRLDRYHTDQVGPRI